MRKSIILFLILLLVLVLTVITDTKKTLSSKSTVDIEKTNSNNYLSTTLKQTAY